MFIVAYQSLDLNGIPSFKWNATKLFNYMKRGGIYGVGAVFFAWRLSAFVQVQVRINRYLKARRTN